MLLVVFSCAILTMASTIGAWRNFELEAVFGKRGVRPGKGRALRDLLVTLDAITAGGYVFGNASKASVDNARAVVALSVGDNQ